MMNRILGSVHRRGIRKTIVIGLRYLWHNVTATRYLWDRLFDLRYGTDTYAPLEVNKLGVTGDNLWHASAYHPARAATFISLMKVLKLPPTYGFVDLGCGKERVLLMAAQFGFRVIRGVEFSSVLCKIARCNVEKYIRFVPAASVISVHLADITEYELHADEHVYFIFNAFDNIVIDKLIMRFQRSLELHPRPLYVIYNNPIYKSAWDASELFQTHHEYTFPNDRIAVYSNATNNVG